MLVAATPVVRRDLVRQVTVTGPVEPLRIVGVSAQATGIALRVHVVEGDRVRRGQLMAELDDRETRAQLRRAQAVHDNAKATFERNEALNNSGTISDVEYEQARAAFEVAAADVALWETRLSFTRIEAPTDGTVITKSVEAGNAVSQNQTLFQIADDSLLVVRVQLSELDIVSLSVGSPVDLTLDAYPDAQLAGRIRRIFPTADPVSRLLPVEVAITRRPDQLAIRAGFLARATFDVERQKGALTVPPEAVGIADSGPYVFVVQRDTLVRREIEVGLTTQGVVQTINGVEEAEMVVTSGLLTLRRGMAVRIQERGEL